MPKVTRAWIENDTIRCLSQVCNLHGQTCPRLHKCKVVDVRVSEYTSTRELERMMKSAPTYERRGGRVRQRRQAD